MAKQPFTPAGVTAKQTELYALSTTALATQADLIRSNFRSWVNNNFDLNSSQQSYLTAMDDRFITYASELTATAILNHLPIILGVVGNNTDVLKLIHINDSLTLTAYPGGISASGTLYFNVEYQP